jgi:hypothetical protein
VSRSIHQTTKSVTFNKGTTELKSMFDSANLDPDAAALVQKIRYKKETKAQRKKKSKGKKQHDRFRN